ncbi:hypothetical protein MACH05_09690 [Qipengyuania nanhaisediminis]
MAGIRGRGLVLRGERGGAQRNERAKAKPGGAHGERQGRGRESHENQTPVKAGADKGYAEAWSTVNAKRAPEGRRGRLPVGKWQECAVSRL